VVNSDCSIAIAPNAINIRGSQTLGNETAVLAGKNRRIVNRVKKPAKTPVG